jgi:hypothetical protein
MHLGDPVGQVIGNLWFYNVCDIEAFAPCLLRVLVVLVDAVEDLSVIIAIVLWHPDILKADIGFLQDHAFIATGLL